MDDKKRLLAAIQAIVDILTFFSLLAISSQLRETSKKTGLVWQQGMSVVAFGLWPLYFGVRLLCTPWNRSRPVHPHNLLTYFLPPAFWGAILTLAGIVIIIYGASVIFRGG